MHANTTASASGNKIIQNFSLCNQMIKTRIIIEIGVRMEKVNGNFRFWSNQSLITEIIKLYLIKGPCILLNVFCTTFAKLEYTNALKWKTDKRTNKTALLLFEVALNGICVQKFSKNSQTYHIVIYLPWTVEPFQWIKINRKLSTDILNLWHSVILFYLLFVDDFSVLLWN